MEQSLKEKVLLSIENLKSKKNKLYFMVQDTKGNAKASVRYIYELAMILKKYEFVEIDDRVFDIYLGNTKVVQNLYIYEKVGLISCLHEYIEINKVGAIVLYSHV